MRSSSACAATGSGNAPGRGLLRLGLGDVDQPRDALSGDEMHVVASTATSAVPVPLCTRVLHYGIFPGVEIHPGQAVCGTRPGSLRALRAVAGHPHRWPP